MIYIKANGPFGLITSADVAVIDCKCLRKVENVDLRSLVMAKVYSVFKDDHVLYSGLILRKKHTKL